MLMARINLIKNLTPVDYKYRAYNNRSKNKFHLLNICKGANFKIILNH